MGGKWVIIIFLLLGVWQIVGSLIEKAGKKQQAQRLKDLAEQRERQLTARGKSAPAAPAPKTATDRAETLAARRRAQLEQLRKRRGQRGTAGDLSAGPAAQPGSAPATGRHPVTFQPAGPAQAPPARPAPTRQPRQQRQPRQPRPASSPVAAPRPVAAPEPEPAPITGESSTRRVVQDAETRPPAGRKSHLPPRPVLPDEPLGPHVLRQMVLFREILEPPVSLRDRQVWERL